MTYATTRIFLKYALYALMALAALWGLNSALGYVPFTPQWQARQLSGKVGQLKADVSRLEREAEGNAEIGRAVETYHTREVIVREIAGQTKTENEEAEDAATPLSEERANRLRAHDRVLCDSTGLCAAPDAP